ncbi:hypothetical protein BT69DRAFT_1285246 [Atractiella rhizophila]|nr:hypothetical protein BT69DRAFT_1285246 [Atractiella rhizophila]
MGGLPAGANFKIDISLPPIEPHPKSPQQASPIGLRQSSQLFRLPAELLDDIFMREGVVDSWEIRKYNLLLICKGLFPHVQRALCWSLPMVKNPLQLWPHIRFLTQHAHCPRMVRNLEVRFSGGLSKFQSLAYIRLLSLCPEIKVLSLLGNFMYTFSMFQETVISVLSGLKNLTELRTYDDGQLLCPTLPLFQQVQVIKIFEKRYAFSDTFASVIEIPDNDHRLALPPCLTRFVNNGAANPNFSQYLSTFVLSSSLTTFPRLTQLELDVGLQLHDKLLLPLLERLSSCVRILRVSNEMGHSSTFDATVYAALRLCTSLRLLVLQSFTLASWVKYHGPFAPSLRIITLLSCHGPGCSMTLWQQAVAYKPGGKRKLKAINLDWRTVAACEEIGVEKDGKVFHGLFPRFKETCWEKGVAVNTPKECAWLGERSAYPEKVTDEGSYHYVRRT